MANPFDQFDAPKSNPFDQFDEPAKPVGGFGASAKQALGSIVKGAGQAAEDFLPASIGKDNAVKKYGQGVIDANPTAIQGFADIADKPWTTVKEATGNAAGSMGAMLGARALGMGITAASPLTGPFAPVTALAGQAIANVGPFIAAGLPSFGSIREKQIAKDPNSTASVQDKTIAALGAGTVGLIEGKFGPQAAALKMMTKEGREAIGKKLAETTLAKGIGYGALKGAAVEGAEELVQNPIEQLAAYDDPRTAENIKETLFGGAMGAIGGGVLGGGTGAANQMLAKQPVQPGSEIAPPTTTPPDGAVTPPAPPAGPVPALGYSPLAGTPTVFPDGSVALNGEQEFARRYAPQKPSEAMGLDPAAGPLSAAAVTAVDTGAHDEIKLAEASAADQAAYEQATAEQERQAAEQDSIDKPITSGPIAEAAMSDEDKRAILFSNQAVADGGKRYAGTLDGDILNGLGKPYPNRLAAARRANMEGKDWTIAQVKDGFVARRKDANDPTNGVQPAGSGVVPAGRSDSAASVAPGPVDGSGTGAKQSRPVAGVLGQSGELPKRVDATPVATTRAQPTTLGKQTTATAGPGFTAKDVTRVQNSAPRADTAPAAPAVEAPATVAGDAATAKGLPAAGPTSVEGAGVDKGVNRDQAPNVKDTGVSGVAPRKTALQRSKQQGLQGLRGKGDQGKPAVGERLPDVLSGTGAKADAAAQPGPDRRRQRLRSGERPLGDKGAAGAESAWVRSPDRAQRPGDDGGGVGKGNGNTGSDALQPDEQRTAASNGPVASQGADGDATANPDLQRQDQLAQGVGQGSGAETDNAARAPQARVDAGARTDAPARATVLGLIASGKAWFGNGMQARQFIAKNGLKDTHEVVKTSATRWEVKAKLQPQEKTNGTQAQEGKPQPTRQQAPEPVTSTAQPAASDGVAAATEAKPTAEPVAPKSLREAIERKRAENAKSDAAVGAKPGKPRLGESANDVYAEFKKLAAGYVSPVGIVPVTAHHPGGGPSYTIGAGGTLEVLTPDGVGTRKATESEQREFHNDLESDYLQIRAMTRPGYGSGYKNQRVVAELHSPSGQSFAKNGQPAPAGKPNALKQKVEQARAKRAKSESKPAIPASEPKKSESEPAKTALPEASRETPPTEAAKPDQGIAMFSARDSAPEKQLPLQQIERLVQSALRGVKNAPTVRVVANPEAIGLRSPVETVPSGVVLANGDIYVFQSGIGSALDVDMVIFHELFHKGLQNVMPRADYVAAMKDIARIDAKVRQYASEWSATNAGKDQLKELAKKYSGKELADQYEALATEEGLARIAEDLKARREMGTKDMRVRRLVSWLAKMADKIGMTRLADALRAMSYSDAEKFVIATIGRAGALNESTAPDSGGARFRAADIVGQTNRQYTPEQLQAMANVGFQVEVPTLKERAQALWKDAGKKLAQGIVDQFAPVKDLDKDAYGLLRLAKGASGAFEAFMHGGRLKLTDGVYDFDDTQRGGVVDKLLIPLQGEHHDFMRWVAANRAERLIGEGKENLFSPQDIADLKTLADGTTDFDYTIQTGPAKGQVTRDRAKVYADANRVFNEFNTNVLDLAEQSGLIDGASRKVWEHEFYVPFYRVADEDSGGVRGMSVKGSVLRQQAFKELKGGKNALNADLLDNTLMNWAHLLDASAKNRAAKATIEAAERMGIATGGNQSTLASMGASIHNKAGVVWFMDGGQKRYSLIDNTGDGPYLMTAINALEYAGMRNPVMNAMGTMKHVLTIGVTASPFFKIRNLIRDSVQVIGTSGINPNVASNVAKGWKLTDPKSDAYFRLLAGGGTIHFGTMLEGSEAKRIQSLVESGVDDATILNSDHKVKAFYRKFIEPGITAYNELGNRGEAINRASLYDQLRKQGASHADASLQARDLMDFSMQGSFTSIRFLTQVVPFFNARIQGLHKLGRAAKEDPARFSAVVGAAALVSLSLLAMFGDDDDWKKREEWDRNNFWWFKFGGMAFRIPKPFEIGAIATLAERGFELAFDKEMTGERFRKQVLTLLGDNLSMNPVPQLVKPIMDVYANKDSFSGRPIETMGMDKLKSDYRFTDRTSMTARGLSTAANAVTGLVGAEALSPVQIDHMLRGYFGWLGTFVVGAGDKLARPAMDQPGRATPDYWKTATGGMVSDLRDAPSRYVSKMYEQSKELEQAYGTWRALQKEGKAVEAQEFAQDNRDKLALYRRVEGVKRAEAKFNQRIRMIERSGMDGDAKRESIRKIQVQKDQIARHLAG